MYSIYKCVFTFMDSRTLKITFLRKLSLLSLARCYSEEHYVKNHLIHFMDIMNNWNLTNNNNDFHRNFM